MGTVVIGAGVIGLSAAVRLQQEGHVVTIVARDFPSPFETVDSKASINYASQWAGAHNRFCPPNQGIKAEERDHAMSLVTFDRLDELAKLHPEAGITFMKGIEYLEDPQAEYRALSPERAKTLGYQDFRLLRSDEFPDDKVKLGFEYRSWSINPMVYCSYLLRKFAYAGGKTLRRDLRDEREIFDMKELGPVRTVVNCSGYGFGDKASFITRGQTCLVANECPATVTRQNADGSWTFSVPRNFNGGTIIGGTKEPDNWDDQPSEAVRTELLSKFAATYPQILGKEGEMRVLRDIVGRRPTRKGGMRLEREDLGDGKTIIHAYGVGGRGYELSWGVAEGVVGLIGTTGTRVKLVLDDESVLKWDLAETGAKSGPYSEIVESDVFINCIYLSSALPSPFVDLESLKSPNRQLSVVCDVSADTTNPHNPVPIYTAATTFDKPTVPVEGLEGPPLSVISIDHLPSLLPREASETYGADLVPHLLNLKDWRNNPVWSRAEALFKRKVAELP